MELHDRIRICSSCSLRGGCFKPVPGVGDIDSRLIIVQSYCTDEDDLMGEPFQSRGGELVQRFLKEKKISAYLTTLAKCAVENEADIQDAHVQHCKKWLWEEIKLVKPKVILTLGAKPLELLLKIKRAKLQNFVDKPSVKKYRIDNQELVVKLYHWYSTTYMLNQGKEFMVGMNNLFDKIKEELYGS